MANKRPACAATCVTWCSAKNLHQTVGRPVKFLWRSCPPQLSSAFNECRWWQRCNAESRCATDEDCCVSDCDGKRCSPLEREWCEWLIIRTFTGIPHLRQNADSDCGITCALMVSRSVRNELFHSLNPCTNSRFFGLSVEYKALAAAITAEVLCLPLAVRVSFFVAERLDNSLGNRAARTRHFRLDADRVARHQRAAC
jgi:hypothetical protein